MHDVTATRGGVGRGGAWWREHPGLVGPRGGLVALALALGVGLVWPRPAEALDCSRKVAARTYSESDRSFSPGAFLAHFRGIFSQGQVTAGTFAQPEYVLGVAFEKNPKGSPNRSTMHVRLDYVGGHVGPGQVLRLGRDTSGVGSSVVSYAFGEQVAAWGPFASRGLSPRDHVAAVARAVGGRLERLIEDFEQRPRSGTLRYRGCIKKGGSVSVTLKDLKSAKGGIKNFNRIVVCAERGQVSGGHALAGSDKCQAFTVRGAALPLTYRAPSQGKRDQLRAYSSCDINQPRVRSLSQTRKKALVAQLEVTIGCHYSIDYDHRFHISRHRARQSFDMKVEVKGSVKFNLVNGRFEEATVATTSGPAKVEVANFDLEGQGTVQATGKANIKSKKKTCILTYRSAATVKVEGETKFKPSRSSLGRLHVRLREQWHRGGPKNYRMECSDGSQARDTSWMMAMMMLQGSQAKPLDFEEKEGAVVTASMPEEMAAMGIKGTYKFTLHTPHRLK